MLNKIQIRRRQKNSKRQRKFKKGKEERGKENKYFLG